MMMMMSKHFAQPSPNIAGIKRPKFGLYFCLR